MIYKKNNLFQKIIKRNFFKSNFDDYTFYFKEGYEQFRAYYPNAEMQSKSYIKKILKKDSIVLDIGSNVGYYSAILSFFCTEGLVLSIEADTENFKKLQSNLNHKFFSNVKKFNFAVGNHNNQKKDFIFSIWNYKKVEKIFNFKTIDTFINEQNLERVNFIKIDIDGYEIECLEGMINTLNMYKPILMIEINDKTLKHRLKRSSEIFDLLNDNNYREFLVYDDENYFFFPPK